MTNKTWHVTMDGKEMRYEQNYNVPNGQVAIAGSTMVMPLNVFLDGIEKMREMGAVIVEGSRK